MIASHNGVAYVLNDHNLPDFVPGEKFTDLLKTSLASLPLYESSGAGPMSMADIPLEEYEKMKARFSAFWGVVDPALRSVGIYRGKFESPPVLVHRILAGETIYDPEEVWEHVGRFIIDRENAESEVKSIESARETYGGYLRGVDTRGVQAGTGKLRRIGSIILNKINKQASGSSPRGKSDSVDQEFYGYDKVWLDFVDSLRPIYDRIQKKRKEQEATDRINYLRREWPRLTADIQKANKDATADKHMEAMTRELLSACQKTEQSGDNLSLARDALSMIKDMPKMLAAPEITPEAIYETLHSRYGQALGMSEPKKFWQNV